jgi:hypothetical protein
VGGRAADNLWGVLHLYWGSFSPGDVFIFVEGRVTTRYKCVSLTFVSGGATTRYKCAHSTGVSPCPGLHICTGSCYDPVEMC